MRILQLCHKPPFPPKDGGCIAMNNITEGLLKQGHFIHLLTVSTHKHPLVMDELPKDYIQNTHLEAVFLDTKVNLVDAFSNLVTRDSYNISRFFSLDFDMLVVKTLNENEFDIVHIESLFMTPYIPTIRRYSNAKVVLRSHNLEFMIWERMATASKNKAKKVYLKYLAGQLKKYELNIIKEVDGIAAISESDKKKYTDLESNIPIINIPFGIDLKKYGHAEVASEAPSLFHLGSLDWLPNLEGVTWFLEEVWPAIHAKHPHLKFYVAGRNIPVSLADHRPPNVEIVGEVNNAMEFIRSKSIMVVPLLSAGGVRVKIIEGMALGKAIVSTKIGAEGIDAKNGKNILLANDSNEFVEVIDRIVEKPELLEEIGKNARELVKSQFDNQVITNNLVNFYKALLPS